MDQTGPFSSSLALKGPIWSIEALAIPEWGVTQVPRDAAE